MLQAHLHFYKYPIAITLSSKLLLSYFFLQQFRCILSLKVWRAWALTQRSTSSICWFRSQCWWKSMTMIKIWFVKKRSSIMVLRKLTDHSQQWGWVSLLRLDFNSTWIWGRLGWAMMMMTRRKNHDHWYHDSKGRHQREKNVFFRALPEWWGGGSTHARSFWPSF